MEKQTLSLQLKHFLFNFQSVCATQRKDWQRRCTLSSRLKLAVYFMCFWEICIVVYNVHHDSSFFWSLQSYLLSIYAKKMEWHSTVDKVSRLKNSCYTACSKEVHAQKSLHFQSSRSINRRGHCLEDDFTQAASCSQTVRKLLQIA